MTTDRSPVLLGVIVTWMSFAKEMGVGDVVNVLFKFGSVRYAPVDLVVHSVVTVFFK